MARNGSGDVVYEIGGTADDLIAAAERGAAALRKTDKAASDLSKQIDRVGSSQAQFQRGVNSSIGITDRFTNSAKASARVFAADWDKSISQVNKLKSQLDPLYASSMRYEQALEQLDAAQKKGIISQAEHTRLLDLAGKAYLSTGEQATVATARFGTVGAIFEKNATQIQMVGYQLQDVAVQLSSGTRASTVFAQQGSQLLSAFGPVGVMLGTLAAVTLPLLGAAFGSAANGGKTLDETVTDLQKSVQLVDAAVKNYTAEGLEELKKKYGEIDQSILTMIEHQRQFAIASAEMAAQSAVRAFADEYGALAINLDAVGTAAKGPQTAIMNMAKDLGLSTSQTRDLVRALQDANDAKDMLGRSEALSRAVGLLQQSTKAGDALTGALVDAETALKSLAKAVPEANWLSGMIGQAQTLGQTLWNAAMAKAKLAGTEAADATGASTPFAPGSRARTAPPEAPAMMDGKVLSGSATGGGSKTDKTDTELKRLQLDLMTKAEAEKASYDERQKLLEQALQKKLLTTEQYNGLLAKEQTAHQKAMAQIDVWRYGDGLQQTETFFGNMANAFQSGNERLARIGQVFGAAEALVNALRAFNQVLADKTLPWFAKIPAAAGVLAAGMRTVSAIKGGGHGGGSAPGVASYSSGVTASPTYSASAPAASSLSSSAAAAAPEYSQIVKVSLFGDRIGSAGLQDLFDQINRGIQQGYKIERVEFAR